MDNIEERLWAAIEEDDFEVVSLEGTELAQRAAAYQKMQSLFGLLCSPASEGAGQEEFFEQPSQIGRYQVRKKLGEGGFGRVFLAYDPMLNRLVAVKIPRPELFPSEGDLERFVREAELGASVKHPGLVTVYDVCRDQESCYIVMEYIEGGVLSDVIGESSLGLNQRVQIIIDLASALDHAHRAGLVHRDIKPSNIFLDRNGSPHIGDFGLAITPSNSRHQHESAAGTPLYMSPELLGKNPSRSDKRSDIWSLGVVLYELLTGTHPFALRENDEVFELVLGSEQGLSKDRNLVVSDSLEECCKKALNKNPAERYAHAAEFADELRLAIYQAPSNTSSVGRVYGPEAPTASEDPVKPFTGFKARFSASLVLVSVAFLLTLVFFVMTFRGKPLAEDLKRSSGAQVSPRNEKNSNSVVTDSSPDGGELRSVRDAVATRPSLAMNTRSKQDFSSTDLATVQLQLMESHAVNIYIDHASLNYEGISAYERLSLDLSEATLETYLQRIFVDEFGLAFHLLDDVIVVTSKVQSGYLRELSDQFSARLKKYGSKKLQSTVGLAISDSSGMKSLPIQEVVDLWSAEFEMPITLNAAVNTDGGAELAGGMSNDVGRRCYGLLVPQFTLRTQLVLTCYLEHLVAEVDGDRMILTTNEDLKNRRVSGFEKLAKSGVTKKELLLSITRRKRDAKYRLRDRTSQSFTDLPLDEAIQQIALSHDVPIHLDYPSLKAVGLSGREPINLTLKDVPLEMFLRQMLHEELSLGVYAFDDLLVVTILEFMELIEDELALMDGNLYGGSVLSKSSLLGRPYVGRPLLVPIEEAVDRLNAQFRFEKKILLDDEAVQRVTSEFWGANEGQRYIQVELLPGVSLKTHLVMIACNWGLTATIHEGQLFITTPKPSEE